MAIDVRVYSEEVTARIDQLPSRLKRAIRAKMQYIFDTLEADVLNTKIGKFTDPKQIKTGIEDQGGALIGFFDYEQDPGVYPISPKNYAFLWSKERHFFARHVFAHPYPNLAPTIEKYLAEKRGWITEQLKLSVKEI